MGKRHTTASSDIGLLVDLLPNRDLFDLVVMKQELKAEAGFKIDVVIKNSLSKLLREKILHKARPL